MVRSILGAVAGYIAMAVFVMITFTVFYMILGTEGSFQPGSYEPTGAWLIGGFVLGIIGALAGGFTCAKVGKTAMAVRILIGIVVVLGIISALPDGEVVMERAGDVDRFAAMTNAVTPTWVAWTNIIIGVVGAWFGAKKGGVDAFGSVETGDA